MEVFDKHRTGSFGLRFSVHDPLAVAAGFTALYIVGLWLPAIPLFDDPAHYLPLHTGLEFVAIAISAMIFALGWSVRKEPGFDYLPVLAGIFLAVALIDFLHTLSYPGMPPLVTPSSPEKAINFWLAGRLVATAALLTLAFLPASGWIRLNAAASLLLGLAVAAMVWQVVIHQADWLPRTFIPGSGLTPFKLKAEYLLVAMSCLAAWQFARRARVRRDLTFDWLAAGAWTLALAELFFTLYQNVTDLMNLLGHVFKAAGYLMIYRALFVAAVRMPYQRLATTQNHLQATLEAIPDVMVETDVTGRILDGHTPGGTVLGLRPAELVGRHITEILAPEAAEIALEALGEAAETGLSHGHQLQVLHEGEPIWFELSVARKQTLPGMPVSLVTLARDITNTKRAETTLRDSEKRFRDLIELSADWVWATDEKLSFTYSSPRVQSMLGYETGEIIGDSPFEYVSVSEAECMRQRFEHLASSQQPFNLLENTFCSKGGPPVVLESSAMPVFDSAGGFRGYRGIARDVTDRKRAENELRIAAIAFESQEGMMVTDVNGTILRTNQAFNRISGYEPDEVLGKTPAILKSDRHGEHFFRSMWDSLRQNHYWEGEVWNRRKDGELFATWLTISGVRGADGKITNYVAAFNDITQHKRAQEQIHDLAFYDPLTRLPNRRLLRDRLEQALASSSRSDWYGGLLFLDLDHFKVVNDTLGHEVGDRLLVEVGQRLQRCVREGDTVARISGDEFVVLLEALNVDVTTAAAEVEAVGDKIRYALSQPYHFDGVELRQYQGTASIGVALFRGQDVASDELLKRVDVALYQAKGDGRDAVRFFDPSMQLELEARTALETDLRQAVPLNQLQLYYQAQVDTAGRIRAVEGLLRWQHPERGLVMPAQFIPLAEESSLIQSIGHWVLETACDQLHAWGKHAATRDLQLAVNVSAGQFRQPDFVDQMHSLIERYAIDPTRLKLELTETLVLHNVGETIEKMNQLKALGIAFSMDDFGTGYSSLAYLKRLPLTQLKIDRSFIANLGSDSNDEAIVHSIIALAKSMGLDAIAEGVETEGQRRYLEDSGCGLFQGFLFSTPVPLAEFEQLLEKQPASSGGAVG